MAHAIGFSFSLVQLMDGLFEAYEPFGHEAGTGPGEHFAHAFSHRVAPAEPRMWLGDSPLTPGTGWRGSCRLVTRQGLQRRAAS